jgi:hypothetical protein
VRKGILEVERPVWDRLSSILKERIEELGVRDSLEPFVRWAGKFFIAENDLEAVGMENYLEAVGIMTALKEGIALFSVRRPLEYTKVETASLVRKTGDSLPPRTQQ